METANTETLNNLLKGEDQGVAMSEKVADNKLDEKSTKLVHDIIQVDHDHIKSLEKLLDMHQIQ